MKNNFIVLFFLLDFYIAVCQTNYYPETPRYIAWPAIYIKKNNIKEIHVYKRIPQSKDFDEKYDTILWEKYVFDTSGKEIELNIFNGMTYSYTSFVRLYNKGRLTSTLELKNNSQDTIGYVNFVYSDDQRTVQVNSYTRNRNLTTSILYRYSKNMKLDEYRILNWDGVLISKTYYKYGHDYFETKTLDSANNIRSIHTEVNYPNNITYIRDSIVGLTNSRNFLIMEDNRMYSELEATRGNDAIIKNLKKDSDGLFVQKTEVHIDENLVDTYLFLYKKW